MFGNILVIANPTARSGKAAQVAAQMASTLDRIKAHTPTDIEKYSFHYTVAPKDATSFVKSEGAHYKTVLAIGGDGIVNEVVNGLMAIPESIRPRFGLIPCGNGDDFARSIGMDRNPTKSLQQLESNALTPKRVDVASANNHWFIETLSFGLDAAIALGTQELRTKTRRTGTSLYLQCGIDQLKNHRDIQHATIQLDDQQPKSIACYLLTLQNGISYGGGFKVCPHALLNDGLLDICYVEPPLSLTAATKLFLKAKNGKHTNNPQVHFAQARKVHVAFDHVLPSQIDGERFGDTEATIELTPGALEVLMP